MMKKQLLIYIFILTLIPNSNLFADSKFVNVSNLDIAGIKLGMNKKQAFKAISKKLHLKQSDIIKTPFPGKYSVSYGQDNILIKFTATSIDPKNLAEVVSGVFYRTPYSVANNELMKKNAGNKYDANLSYCPDKPCLGYLWCETTSKGCPNEAATLRYYGNELSLYTTKYNTALRKLREKKLTGKSAF